MTDKIFKLTAKDNEEVVYSKGNLASTVRAVQSFFSEEAIINIMQIENILKNGIGDIKIESDGGMTTIHIEEIRTY